MDSPRLHLIFDADDTLWEANILFERAINDFITWIEHPTLDRDAVRATLHDIEAANSVALGYGTRVFLQSLHDCFEALLERPPTAADQARIEALAAPLLAHAIEPIADVDATLTALGTRHDLLLLTKGDNTEQQNKIDLSGFAGHFRRIFIVPEKTTDVYVNLVEGEALDRAVDLDDRQLTQVGYPARARGRSRRGVHPERQHVGARARRARRRCRPPAPHRPLRRAALAFLVETA